ncbi:MAG: histidine triad nucleotide-binding protein [Patescibacteria group bacterium]|jgi:histidine triad (HIT) family protein
MCIFCQIINKEISAQIVYEDDKIVAFENIQPKAPIHLLIVPTKHIPSINHLEVEDKELTGDLFLVAKKIAKSRGLDESGYKLVFNVGKGAGQSVDHIHLHLLGGWKSEEERDIPGMP